MIQIIRHGDLALISIDKLPDGLEPSKSKVLMTGSGGNDHTVTNCIFYPKQENEFVFGYLEAKKNAKLYHREHGKKKVNGLMKADLPAGIYELRKQNEITNEGMKPVID